MLRLSMSTEEYLMIGDNIKLVFLGGTGNHLRIMVDAPRDVDIVRSSVLEKNNPELKKNGPKYYAHEENPGMYVPKKKGKNSSNL